MRRGGQRALCSSTVLDSLASHLQPSPFGFEMAEIKALPDGCRGPCVLPMEQSAECVMEATRSCLQDTGVLLKSKPFSVMARIRHGPFEVVIKARVYRDTQGTFLDLTRRRGDGLLFVRTIDRLREALGLET